MERPFSCVPRRLLVGSLLVALLHAAGSQLQPPQARVADLPPPPSAAMARVMALGDGVAAARFGLLWLASFDAQPGVLLRWQDMNYQHLGGWMDRLLQLDPQTTAPLLMMSKVYAAAPDTARQRQAYDWVYRQFMQDPNRRWPWLAHVAFEARHHQHNLALARQYAQALRRYATGPQVPSWAKQMEIFLLADLNELEAAKILLGGLIESGQVSDPRERAFLLQRLREIEARLDEH